MKKLISTLLVSATAFSCSSNLSNNINGTYSLDVDYQIQYYENIENKENIIKQIIEQEQKIIINYPDITYSSWKGHKQGGKKIIEQNTSQIVKSDEEFFIVGMEGHIGKAPFFYDSKTKSIYGQGAKYNLEKR